MALDKKAEKKITKLMVNLLSMKDGDIRLWKILDREYTMVRIK